MTIETFRIAESAVTIGGPEKLWEGRTRNVRSISSSHNLDAFNVAALAGPPEMDEVWPLLHPAIVEVAAPRFEAGHYADAVEASLKSISESVRSRTGIDDDGQSLMKGVFSLNSPKLILGDLETQTGRSMQLGYMQIFAGTMTGIRNPKAHGNVQIDAIGCLHFFFSRRCLPTSWTKRPMLPLHRIPSATGSGKFTHKRQ